MPKLVSVIPDPIQVLLYPDGVAGDSMAKQSFKDECDINNILAQYERSGFISHVKSQEGVYADVSSGQDYRSGLHVVMEAQRMFMELPAKIRQKFDNDPARFLDFVSDPANVKEMIDLGLGVEVKKPADVQPASDKAPEAVTQPG